MKARLGIGSMLLVSLIGCDDDPMSISSGKNGAMLGSVRKIASSGEVFRLGSSDLQALREESPGWTRFAHDFWLDTTETTQGEFESLMGRNPSPVSATGASKPVVNATWFDAILFCNARSKRDGLDTVYEYRSLSRDAGGSVWEIQGLASRLERSGWRLPTEAEWEYAARAGTSTTYPWGELADSAKATEFSWYQKNSQAALHEVARLKPNAWGIYDMSGNAMEWVQDWKGSYPQDTVADFAGLDAPSDIPEAPLKGGSYTYGLEHLRPSSRSATYAAYRSAKAEYVGFRCARGGFSPSYINASGQSVQAPPVSILRPDLARLLGAQSARLVFLNRSNGKGVLSWIDFGEAVPTVRSFPDKAPVFHPSISPDGKWVAWCTAMEGNTGASRIKARRLSKSDTAVFDLGEGAIPRWWADGTDTFLVRANALDNLSSGWAATSTTAQRWSGGALTGSVQAWSNAGSYHDGRSGSYLYTGYRRLRQYDVAGGKDRILFTYPQNGKRVGDTSQVCNASAAPDGSGRVLFLDFGYSEASSVVGRPYGIHEVAFVADSLGDIVKTVAAPEGKSQWDHLEWSNSSQWAVAMALEPDEAHREVHLLDLGSGKSEAVVRGEELWMPNLWVGRVAPPVLPGTADPDSAGAWDTPANSVSQSEFAAKTQEFWPLRSRIEIAAVGSSRLKDGIAPELFKNGFAFNWGYDASESVGDFTVVRDYLLPHAPRLKVVVLSLMPGWFVSLRGEVSWNNNSKSRGYLYDASHGFWKTGIPTGYLERIASRPSPTPGRFDSLGGTWIEAGGWGAKSPQYLIYPGDLESAAFKANFADLTDLADTCRSRGIHLVFVNFPQSPAYCETPSMGRWGPSWATWIQLRQRLWQLESSNRFFHLYDANQDGLHGYPDSAAANSDHLSTWGARILTQRLDSLIGTFVPR